MVFRSRIDATARSLGVNVAYTSDIAQAREQCMRVHPDLVFIDLSDAGIWAKESYREIRIALPGVRLVGFASHVELKRLNAARDDGFEMVLSRSEFATRLPQLLGNQ
jgi:DNA-binding NarL/FixJ family response regulator